MIYRFLKFQKKLMIIPIRFANATVGCRINHNVAHETQSGKIWETVNGYMHQMTSDM